VTEDLYIWESPRDMDAAAAADLVADWQAAGGIPRESPFTESTSVGWFVRELKQDYPELELETDAVPTVTSTPIWLSGSNEPPARVVVIRDYPAAAAEVHADIMSLATKYDLAVFYPDGPNGPVLQFPFKRLEEYASANFWPAGARQAATAGLGGAILAAVAWVIGIPIVSGVLIVVGVFMSAMSVLTFVWEGRRAIARRRGSGTSTPPGASSAPPGS
jgi:hypothetical protein